MATAAELSADLRLPITVAAVLHARAGARPPVSGVDVNTAEVSAAEVATASGEGPLRAAVHRHVAATGTAVEAVFYELQIPKTYERIDVTVVAGGLLEGIEVKSGRDNLTRLPRQVGAYSRLCDRCTLVADARHLRAALAVVPEWWAVTVSDGANRLETLRPGGPNPGPLDGETLVRRSSDRVSASAAEIVPGGSPTAATAWRKRLSPTSTASAGSVASTLKRAP